jgi:hypothetical protein
MKYPPMRNLQTKFSNRSTLLIFLSIFAILGITVTLLARAAGSPIAFEPETGALAAGAATTTLTGQSGTGAVKFTAGTTPTPSPTPSPTPVGELMGWQLTPTNIGLAPFGLSCDTLPVYTGTDTPPNGTVISGKLIKIPLYLTQGAVTIEKSCIKPTTDGPTGILSTWDTNVCPSSCATAKGQVIVRDSEIDGSLLAASDIAYHSGFIGVGQLERNYIHDVGTGIAFFDTGDTYTASSINNYVARLVGYGNPATTGSHDDTFTVRDYTTATNPNRQMVVRGNYFKADSANNDTGSLFIQAYAGFIDNMTVENNYLIGDGYQLILEANANGYGTHMNAINNRFTSTGFGPGYTDGGPGWATWTENYMYDATKPDGKGAIVTKR